MTCTELRIQAAGTEKADIPLKDLPSGMWSSRRRRSQVEADKGCF